jgi:hypothetical protein
LCKGKSFKIPSVCETDTIYFNWSNAVIEILSDAANIANIITELDARPEHLQHIASN